LLQQDGQDAAHGYVDDVDCVIVKLHQKGTKGSEIIERQFNVLVSQLAPFRPNHVLRPWVTCAVKCDELIPGHRI